MRLTRKIKFEKEIHSIDYGSYFEIRDSYLIDCIYNSAAKVGCKVKKIDLFSTSHNLVKISATREELEDFVRTLLKECDGGISNLQY